MKGEVQSGAAGCVKGFATCFLDVPPACLGSMAAAVQPSCLWNSPKTCYKTFYTVSRICNRLLFGCRCTITTFMGKLLLLSKFFFTSQILTACSLLTGHLSPPPPSPLFRTLGEGGCIQGGPVNVARVCTESADGLGELQSASSPQL